MSMHDLVKKRQVRIFIIAFILIGLAPLMFKGLSFGRDFTGGTLIQVKLDHPVSTMEMGSMVSILTERLNTIGLKDLAIRSGGDEFVIVEIAETNPKVINEIQALIGEEGKFEGLFESKVVLSGEDIVEVVTNPQQGFGWRATSGGFSWSVPFILTNEGAQKFADGVAGKCTTETANAQRCKEQVFMFIDRPENSIIVLSPTQYDAEKEVPINLVDSQDKMSIEDLMVQSDLEYLIFRSVTNETFDKLQNKTVIFNPEFFKAEQFENISAGVKEVKKTSKYWIVDAIGIENIVYLTPGITEGKPISEPSITGFSLTEEAAYQEIKRLEVLLRSGKLPVSVSLGGTSTISSVLGSHFMRYSGISAIVAMIIVAGIILVRYKRPKIIIPLVITSFSEVIMIVGLASLIGWQIDLPAVAGIISVAGTGVDHQIVITDEVLKRGVNEESLSLKKKVQNAFNIIFMSASTIILAMLPLWFIGIGTLRGFALITIMGSLIGVLIARPAFGEIIKEILKK